MLNNTKDELNKFDFAKIKMFILLNTHISNQPEVNV
jgi:hypothetical protein